MMMQSRTSKWASWALRILAAAILFQTLFFKFTGAEESVYIFSKLGMEPWGRLGTGLAELIASILLLFPPTVALGAILAAGLMAGAIVSHLTRLGIVVQDDSGLLFALACIVLFCSLLLLVLHRSQIPVLGSRFRRREKRAAACGINMTGGGDASREGPRVLILGGGFGGVYAALELEKALAYDRGIQVTLVNRENFFLFTPMLHEVAASDLDLTNIVSPVRKMLRRVDFFQGDVDGVDLDRKTVRLVHGLDRHAHEVGYDYLILALGSTTNFFGLPGLEERALTMKSLSDAVQLRNRLIAHLEVADTECAKAEREALLTFVVAGGGFAGVETIGGINDFLREALPFYPHLSEEDLRMVLVHPGETILPELGEELGRYAQTKLTRQGVEIRTKTRVTAIDNGGVKLSDGMVLKTKTLIWTAGTSPHSLLATLPCEKDRGRLRANEFLEIPGYPGVWAAGDCAVVPDARTGRPHPPTAQHALREGKVLARNVLAAIHGGKKMAFDFRTLGQLAAIGRRTGVARVFGFNFSGFIAWWMWRTIYLSKLPRLEKKLRVALDWTLDVLFDKDLVQYLSERAPTMSQAEQSVLQEDPVRIQAAR
ncbi:MAG: FAD-dependent oxidoreductase [Acidobacteria bacterium]|nr:FAD-dependent oxidoreductase [Acidobacteriota bacterium]